jgi:hypothetical protein
LGNSTQSHPMAAWNVAKKFGYSSLMVFRPMAQRVLGLIKNNPRISVIGAGCICLSIARMILRYHAVPVQVVPAQGKEGVRAAAPAARVPLADVYLEGRLITLEYQFDGIVRRGRATANELTVVEINNIMEAVIHLRHVEAAALGRDQALITDLLAFGPAWKLNRAPQAFFDILSKHHIIAS